MKYSQKPKALPLRFAIVATPPALSPLQTAIWIWCGKALPCMGYAPQKN